MGWHSPTPEHLSSARRRRRMILRRPRHGVPVPSAYPAGEARRRRRTGGRSRVVHHRVGGVRGTFGPGSAVSLAHLRGSSRQRVPCPGQGRQDLNLQPAVLETAALPVELRPLRPPRWPQSIVPDHVYRICVLQNVLRDLRPTESTRHPQGSAQVNSIDTSSVDHDRPPNPKTPLRAGAIS